MTKAELLKLLAPQAALEALTADALQAIPQALTRDDYYSIHRFPLRVDGSVAQPRPSAARSFSACACHPWLALGLAGLG